MSNIKRITNLPDADLLKELLSETINEVAQRKGLYHKEHCFIRDTQKMTFENTYQLIYSMTSSSLSTQLFDFFAHDHIPCVSTLTEARKKLDYHFFKDVHDSFMQKVNGFITNIGNNKNSIRFYAYDGSNIPLETFNKSKLDCVDTRSDTRKRAGIYFHGLYDVNTGLFIDFHIERITERNETRAAKIMVNRVQDNSGICFMGDRGYHCFDLESLIMQKGLFFIHRLKERDFYKLLGISKQDDLAEEFDEPIKKVLVPNDKGLALKRRKNPEIPFYGVSSKSFKFCEFNDKELRYDVRLLKIRLDHDQYEYIVTNLSQDEYSLDEIKELYCQRWYIERGYENLKYGIGLHAIHARLMDLVKQEIYAGLTLHNAAAILILIAEQKEKERQETDAQKAKEVGKEPKNYKYEYKINRTYVFQTFRNFLYSAFMDGETYVQNVIRHKVPIKPGRHFQRNGIKKAATNYHRCR